MGIFWIASYPKSGNTWVRAFIANLLCPNPPVPINELGKYVPSEAQMQWYQQLGFGDRDLSKPSVDGVRVHLKVQEMLAARMGKKHLLLKTHSMLGQYGGVPMIRDDLTVGAIYIVRDPRDVAVSVSKHFGFTLDEAIDFMASPKAYTGGGGDRRTVFEYLGSWPDHVRSWSQAGVPVIRYEDLSERPTESFRKIASALGLGGKAAAIDRAIAAADFKALQAAEASGGFAESSDKTERFFRSGKVGGWRDQLSEQQQSRLAELDGELMKRFKYR